ncbi:tetratricopeptide repeat protein [Massilia niastensis]|uniref:tetratricopeptide repeat protein n=1 Tax=Massilia niastensis TaxID=544911 RepID=UPI00039AF4BB|nr:tetratricopeptide repeat protein [Massilia niastensis]
MIARLIALLLAAATPGWVLAQSAGPDTEAPDNAGTPQQQLYQDALQSLADGRKSDASEALSRLIEQEPQHAGAWLDLALIQCSLGHADKAERLFANVETRFSPSRDILELIAEARDSGCADWRPASSATVNISRGVDDNVNQGASNSTFIVTGPDGEIELPLLEDFLPKRDQYTQASVDYVRDMTANGSIGFLQFQGRHYDRLHEYDTGALFAGIETPYRLGRWALRTTGLVGLTILGSKLYQRQVQAQARVTPPLPLPPRTQLHLLGSVTHTSYASLSAFDSNVYELRALLGHQADSFSASLNAGLLSDRARDQRPGGNRHGNSLSVSVRKPLGWNTMAELAYTRQSWNSATPYSPALLIDEVRAQRTHMLRAALSYQVSKRQSVALEARDVRNRENISIFQYNNRQVQLSWQWRYP